MSPAKKRTTKRASKTTARADARTAGTAETVARLTYKTKDVLPSDPNVRIIFHGLLSFFFDSTNMCRVGVPNTSHGNSSHPHPHEFNVAAWADVGGVCTPIPLPPEIRRPGWLSEIRLEAHGTRNLDGVYVYQKGLARRDKNDWRWVIDFERDLYPEGVKNKTETLKPHVAVDNGLFYTLRKTDSNFILHPDNGGEDKPFGNVAEIVAGNIYLNLGGRVDLKIIPRRGDLWTLPLFALPSIKYEIDITNNCWHGNKPCAFKPNGGGPKDRNDFYLYYETFTKPEKHPTYELICTDCTDRRGTSRKEAERILQELDICYDRQSGPVIRSNDKAPCGPSGQGQSTDPTSQE